MLYDEYRQEAVIESLHNKQLQILNNIVRSIETGYPASKDNRLVALAWNAVMLDAYENIHVYTKEEQDKIDRLLNKVMDL